MSSDFRLLDRIQKEKNIEKLRSMFIETIHSYESEMVSFQETNESQVDILQQQLSDSNASISALNMKMEKMKELHESELESERQKGENLQIALREAENKNQELHSKMEKSIMCDSESIMENDKKWKNIESENLVLKNKSHSLEMKNKALVVGILNIKSQLSEINRENALLRKSIAKFYSTIKKGNKMSKLVLKHTHSLYADECDRVDFLKEGLLDLKEQVKSMRKDLPETPKFDSRLFKIPVERLIGNYLEETQKEIFRAVKVKQNKFKASMSVNLVEAENTLNSIKALSLSIGSAMRLFIQGYKTNYNIMKKACLYCINTCNSKIESAKTKEKKNTKAVRHELQMAKTEIELLQKEKEVAKVKRMKEKSRQSSSLSSRSHSRISSFSSQEQSKPKGVLVSVGTLAHISTPHFDTMKERSKRATIEAEISTLESQLRRKQERITTLEGQITGLRKIIKRTGDNSEEENGKNQQKISDLEEMLREEKKASTKKTQTISRIQRTLEDSKKAATRVEPLTTALNKIFKSCADKLAPLLAEKSISPDLYELDELSKQYFNVPIHKICAPQFSRAYLKKQEHRFIAAMQNDVNVDEMVKIFDGMIDEFINKREESQ